MRSKFTATFSLTISVDSNYKSEPLSYSERWDQVTQITPLNTPVITRVKLPNISITVVKVEPQG